jgi:hypothetical protein
MKAVHGQALLLDDVMQKRPRDDLDAVREVGRAELVW